MGELENGCYRSPLPSPFRARARIHLPRSGQVDRRATRGAFAQRMSQESERKRQFRFASMCYLINIEKIRGGG